MKQGFTKVKVGRYFLINNSKIWVVCPIQVKKLFLNNFRSGGIVDISIGSRGKIVTQEGIVVFEDYGNPKVQS